MFNKKKPETPGESITIGPDVYDFSGIICQKCNKQSRIIARLLSKILQPENIPVYGLECICEHCGNSWRIQEMWVSGSKRPPFLVVDSPVLSFSINNGHPSEKPVQEKPIQEPEPIGTWKENLKKKGFKFGTEYQRAVEP